MKKLISLLLVVGFLFPVVAYSGDVYCRDGRLCIADTTPLLTAIHKKKWQQVPFALSASSKIIRIRGAAQAGEIDLTGAIGTIIHTASGNLTVWYDSNTTKTWTILGGSPYTLIFDGIGADGSYPSIITINGTDTRVEVGAF